LNQQIVVQTTETPGERGYDAHNKVKSRNRHLLLDKTGFC